MEKRYLIKIKNIFKPYRRKIVLILILLFTTTFLNFIIPLLIKGIIDKGFGLNNFSVILKNAIVLFFVYNIDKIVVYVVEHIRLFIYKDIKEVLFNNFYNKIFNINIQYFNDKTETEIFTNLDVDVENISKLADRNSFFLLSQIFSICGGIIGLFYINYILAILVILVVPLKVILSKKFAKVFKGNMEVYLENRTILSSNFAEYIYMIKEAKIFNLYTYSIKKLNGNIEDYLEKNNKLSKINTLNLVSEQLIYQILVLLIYVVGGLLFINGDITLGSVIAFINYCGMVIVPINGVLNVLYMMSGITPSMERYYKLIDFEENEFCDGNLTCANMNSNNIDITFNDVVFSYTDKEFIKNLNFKVGKNEKIALVGMNGSGKTTIFDILLRFNKIDEGNIKLNNNSIYKYNISDYRDLFAVVNQDVKLFSKPIKDNIVLDKDFDKEKYLEIVNLCGLKTLCENNEFSIGNNGQLLSGGQKQKISIARALYSERPILLFDESTSNLDTKSELDIFDLLENELEEKIVILITHNLTLLHKVDKVIFLENGNIVDIGKHEKLMENINYSDYILNNRK